MASARGTSPFAGLAVLLHDAAQVVEVVDIDVVETGSGGFDVPRHAQIHQEKGAIAAGMHGGFENLARENRFIGRNRGDENVGFEQCGIPVPPFDYRSPKFLGELSGAIARAVHDQQIVTPRSRRVPTTCSLTAPAPEPARCAGHLSEDALGKLYARSGDRHRSGTEFGFGADAFTHLERALEQSIQHRARSTLFVRRSIGFANLAEDFRSPAASIDAARKHGNPRQVREAYRSAHEQGATGPVLNRLFQGALEVGKRVRTETELGSRRCRSPLRGVKLAERIFGKMAGTACWFWARAPSASRSSGPFAIAA